MSASLSTSTSAVWSMCGLPRLTTRPCARSEARRNYCVCLVDAAYVWLLMFRSGPTLRSSVCVLVVFGDLFVFNVAILMNYKLRVLRHAAFQVTLVAKRSQATCVRGRRVGQQPLDCLTPNCRGQTFSNENRPHFLSNPNENQENSPSASTPSTVFLTVHLQAYPSTPRW